MESKQYERNWNKIYKASKEILSVLLAETDNKSLFQKLQNFFFASQKLTNPIITTHIEEGKQIKSNHTQRCICTFRFMLT